MSGSEGKLRGASTTIRKGMIFHPTLGYAIPPPIPVSVARRNARERNRVKTVNGGFECLRVHVPTAARAKKMSKARKISLEIHLLFLYIMEQNILIHFN